MRCHEYFLCSALVFLLPAASLAFVPNGHENKIAETSSKDVEASAIAIRKLPIAPVAVAMPSPLKLETKDSIHKTAYLDAFSILKENNTCSQFFGGSIAAVEVLNQLVVQLKRSDLPKEIGIRMSGKYVSVSNVSTGNSYRLFKQALLNANGPFYRWEPHSSDVGSFMPNTKGARVLILLHELAHLMAGPNGKWLIPDDGRDLTKSNRNTRTVEKHCGVQIKALED